MRTRPVRLKRCVCAHKPEHTVCFSYKVFTWTSSLPGLWSITQVVVKTAALRRARAHWGDKFTCGHIEPQEQDEEHFGALLRIRSLPTCAQFAPKQTCLFLSFTAISAWLCPTASLSHSDPTAMSPEIKRIRISERTGVLFIWMRIASRNPIGCAETSVFIIIENTSEMVIIHYDVWIFFLSLKCSLFIWALPWRVICK